MRHLKQMIILIIMVGCILVGTGYYRYREAHTFTLTDEPAADTYLKTEQIQPVIGQVTVWGTQDTDVRFTDAEDPDRQYQIGYITPGMSETIRLEKGRWYIVHGAGEITVRMVNVRVQ